MPKKPVVLLTNALKIEHKGNPANLQETINVLLKYIEERKLTQITTGYNVVVKEASNPEFVDDMIIDVYVGISPNIL
jgi:effector-binding domain-containing protein